MILSSDVECLCIDVFKKFIVNSPLSVNERKIEYSLRLDESEDYFILFLRDYIKSNDYLKIMEKARAVFEEFGIYDDSTCYRKFISYLNVNPREFSRILLFNQIVDYFTELTRPEPMLKTLHSKFGYKSPSGFHMFVKNNFGCRIRDLYPRIKMFKEEFSNNGD